MKPNYFDMNAAGWDTPFRIERAKKWANALRREVVLKPDAVVADFGAGTGLMSFLLAPHVGRVLALDNSTGMLATLQEKCRQSGMENVFPQHFDIESDVLLPGSCDAFVSCMVLHHLREPAQFAAAAWHALRPGGKVAVIDLDSEGGEFHEDHTGVYHHGFNRADLSQLFIDVGFTAVRLVDVFTIRKKGRSGTERDFPMFMLVAEKNA